MPLLPVVLLHSYPAAAHAAQVPEHVRRAFEQPDCRWTVWFDPSTRVRHPYIPAILMTPRARSAHVRLNSLHSRASAGCFCFSCICSVPHGPRQDSRGAFWAAWMRRVDVAWRCGFGRLWRRVRSGATAAGLREKGTMRLMCIRLWDHDVCGFAHVFVLFVRSLRCEPPGFDLLCSFTLRAVRLRDVRCMMGL